MLIESVVHYFVPETDDPLAFYLFPLYCSVYLIISKQVKDIHVVFSNQTEQEKSSLTSEVTYFLNNNPSSTSQTVHQQVTV